MQGALAIPSGIAAYGNAPAAMLPAIVIILAMGLISAYLFSLIGRVCAWTGAKSYRNAWELTVGEAGAKIVALVCTFKPALGNLAYSMILTDSFRSLLMTVGIDWSRTKVLIVITVAMIWPLCLLKNLKVLAPFSILGIAGMVATVLAMTLRYLDGTYTESAQENFLADLPENSRPSFGDIGIRGALRPQMLILICMLATAYVAHYNSPRFYIELQNNTVSRFNSVVAISYVSSALIYVVLATVGFLTFGESSSGYILNNYSTKDVLATFCRIAIAISIMFTYPIVFVGVRDGIIDLIKVPTEQQTAFVLNVLSTLILLVITMMAGIFTDLGVVLSLGGATLATAVIYIFPSLMFRSAVSNLGKDATDADKQEVKIVMSLMWFGIVIGAIGACMEIFGGFSE